MKTFLLLFIFTSFIGHSQIHIGEKSRTIYTYYKQKGVDVKFANWGTGGDDYLKTWDGNVSNSFFFNANDVCTVQHFDVYDRDKLYDLCDAFNIPLDWKSHSKVYKNKKISFFTQKLRSTKGEIIYRIFISLL
jgi:hypothetical protein